MTTVRISVAGICADITSDDPTVTAWVARYLGSWWHAGPPLDHTPATVQVSATVDRFKARRLVDQIDQAGPQTVQYARRPMQLLRAHGAIRAHDGQVAYDIRPDGPITLVGDHPGRVASAASRLAREALRGRLAAAGWVLLHASAVVDRHRQAWLAFGAKAAGKTATAVQLAYANNWSILANDRLFARVAPTGAIQVLPWPAAAAIGLGLLDATSRYQAVATARDQLHSSTPAEVHGALAAGITQLTHDNGREPKAQLFPDQLTTLLGLPLATTANVGAVLLPTIDSRVEDGAIIPGGRSLAPERDAFHADVEDRYPPIWGLRTNETPQARTAVFKQLNRHPRWTAILNHDVQSNTALLKALASSG